MKKLIALTVIVAVPLAIVALLNTPGAGQSPPGGGPQPKGGKKGYSARAGSSAMMGGGMPGAGTMSSGAMGSMMMMGGGGSAAIDPLLAEDLELDSQIQQILGQFDSAADAQTQDAAKKAVAELLDRQFTVRQERRENEIAEIEARVKRLREALDKRAGAKPQIIERRLNDLFSDAEGLGWGDAGGPASGAGQAGFPGGIGAGNLQSR